MQKSSTEVGYELNYPRSVQSLCTTEYGIDALNTNPDLLDQTVALTRATILGDQETLHEYDRIGSGFTAVVYGLPQNPDLVAKVSAACTLKSNWYSGARREPRSLITDLRYMHVLGSYFKQNSQFNFSTPNQYMAMKMRVNGKVGYAQIMQKLPGETVRLADVMQAMNTDEQDQEMDRILCERYDQALGRTVLRHAIGDIIITDRHNQRWYHENNIHIEKDKPIRDAAIHIIDVLGDNGFKHKVAAVIGCIAFNRYTPLAPVPAEAVT